jgi:hypothetical protein
MLRWAAIAVLAALVAFGGFAPSLDSGDSDRRPSDGGGTHPNPAPPRAAAPAAAPEREKARASPEEPSPEQRGERNRKSAVAADDARAPAGRRSALRAPRGPYLVVWVRKGERVPIRTKPGGGRVVEVVGRRTEFGSPTVFWAVRTVGRWAGVSTPALPNDRLGWVRLDRRRLGASRIERSIVVSLSERRVTLREGDEVLGSFTVTIGAPGSRTPTGRYAVTDSFRGGLNPAYGCCAVALSAIQPNLPSGWLGGNRIAIHGNGSGGPLGVAVSNGCLRAADANVSLLVDEVGLGTPVFIRN